ncbi:MAG: hypothetical protein PHI81_08405 [Synergistaceae bacterium]|jgi:hypothetical protein|uniref:PG0541 family transporter-associated protein n=1 Tax=Aminivibrio sp. TaxID=1872489 RepID=UPI001DD7274F|nr:hypothetical protein [Synergistaceae bacterium]MDD3690034.1 hypothetical protein [Synergistaceae bacterium]MDD4022120.1 hypothetical protein [Synergistaceae bacterium]MDD4612448.1 hypothetical protein [Synergistaceae bacterium]NCC56657.1 hypothetical protein [Synergistales bacterium]
MNLVWIFCSEILADEVKEILDSSSVPSYTVWKNVLNRNIDGNKTHWNDAVFPGKNMVFCLSCDRDLLEKLREEFSEFTARESTRREWLEIYVHEVHRLM